MKILVVAGSHPQEWPDFTPETFDLFVGIDRGSLYILEQGWPLTMAVGDFDSLNAAEKEQVFQYAQEVVSSQPVKDDTDTQLALESLFARWPEAQATIIGATGGRLDHLLANIWLGVEPRFQPFVTQIRLWDQQNYLQYFLPGEHLVKKQSGYKYLAYCCLTPVQNLTLTHSKYLLDHVQVTVPTSYASNEFLGEVAQFSFDSGVIAVIQSKD